MKNTLHPHPYPMEKIIHQNQMFPLSEFIDYFDVFPDRCFLSHWHPEFELHVILSGSAEYKINGTSYIIEKGCGIYIASTVVHMAKSLEKNTTGYNITISPDFLSTLIRYTNCEQYTAPLFTHQPESLLITPDRKEGFHILDSLRKMHDTDSSHTAYDLYFLEYFIRILRNLLALFPKSTENAEDNSKLFRKERMKDMIDYIHQNYTKSITIQDIATAANISKSECYRCFNEFSEMTPTDYINKFRLQQAAHLLITSDKSMSDICYQTGFNNTSYFAKKFKEHYNQSPNSYRADKIQSRDSVG